MRQLRNKVERRGHIMASEKTSRKKWTDGRQLRDKVERSGLIRGS